MQTRGSAWGSAAVCSIAVACNAPLPARATKLWRRRASEATLLFAVSGLPTTARLERHESAATLAIHPAPHMHGQHIYAASERLEARVCQLTRLVMRPRVADHVAQGLDMLAIETEQSAAFCERCNEVNTLISMLCGDAACHRTAVCTAHGDAGDIFASEGARRPFPAPDGRGRRAPRPPARRLGQMCAAAGLELGTPMCPHTHRVRRGGLPGCYRCASLHQPSLSDAAPRTVHSRLTRPACHPCAGFCALALPTCRAGWPAAWHDARGCLWRRRRLRGGGGRAWAGPAVATGHAAASRAAGTRLSRRCGCARTLNSASVPYRKNRV